MNTTKKLRELETKSRKIEEDIQAKEAQLQVVRQEIVELEQKQEEANTNLMDLATQKSEIEARLKALG